MNRGKTDALTAAVDRDLLQEKRELTAHSSDQSETDNRFPPGYIDDRPSPTRCGERREFGRKGN